MGTLTDEQKAFLSAEDRIVLCACPGSGKTFIVSKKLIKYLETWPYAYRGIAVLSFTNVASKEVIRQTKELADTKFHNIGFPHFIGTLDSFINTFIFLRFGYLMNKTDIKRPKIIFENIKNFSTRERACFENGCTNNLNWFHWSDNQLLKNGQPISCSVASPKPCVLFKKAMLDNGFATQREVPALSLLLLKKYPSIAKEITYRFPVIMVDEAQDTSREQMEIIDLLADNGAQTIIVGDPDQAIYEWRNATPEYFKNKLTDANWNSLYLTVNFRSSQHICNATSMFSSVLEGKQPVQAKGEYADFDTKPILLQFEGKNRKNDVINWFKQLCLSKGINPESGSVAILTRGRIHSNTEISDLWKTDETYLLALATYLWHCASKKHAYVQCERALFCMMIGDSNGLSSVEMRKIIENKMEYSAWKKKVISLLTSLPKASSSLRDWKNLLTAKIEELVEQGTISIHKSRNINDIIKLKTRIKVNRKTYSTEFLDNPLQIYFEKRTTKGTTFSSVHGVKGETFDATLFMIESNTGNTVTPSFLNSGRLDDELMRIAYVAMTRPRKLLVVSIPKQKSNNNLNRFPTELWDYEEI